MQPMQISDGHSPTPGLTARRWHWALLLIISASFWFFHNQSARTDRDSLKRTVGPQSDYEDELLKDLALARRQHICFLDTLNIFKDLPKVLATDLMMPFAKAVHYSESDEKPVPISLMKSLKFKFPPLDNDAFYKIHHSMQSFCNGARGVSIVSNLSTVVDISIAAVNVNVEFKHACQVNGDEAFNITFINPTRILISACSSKAVSLALASTMTQLFTSQVQLIVPAFPFIVEDYPKYRWRGVMVDVARHFQPLALLKRCVDAMKLSKLNVLHLHLTDAQSFPVLLDDVPGIPLSLLAKNAAYDNNSKVYHKFELKEFVEYARIRGIDVVPEIDVPAHAFSWGKSFPDIVVNCSIRAGLSETPMDLYALDPSNPYTYSVVNAIYKQIAEIFPYDYVHVGGDEVDYRCWQESPSLRQWAKRQGNLTELSVFGIFESKVFAIIRQLGKIPISWQGVIDTGVLPEDHQEYLPSIVQPWKCWSGLSIRASNSAINSKHPVVMSSCWYLDYDTDWLSMMSVDQLASSSYKFKHNSTVSDSFEFGGEAAMWTERVDHTNLECRMWPRAGAIASRLWGFPENLDRNIGNFSIGHNILDGQTLTLDVDISQSMFIALVHFKQLLVSIGVIAASVTFHRVDMTKTNYVIIPEGNFWSEKQAIEFIRNNQRVGITLSSNSKLQPNLVEGAFSLTCQCLANSVPMSVQRPHHLNNVMISQLNVADGRLGGGNFSITDWFLEKANSGTLMIGLCELNGWSKLKSDYKVVENRPIIEYYASKGGFTHSFVMVNSQPFNLGVISALPFHVYGQYGPPSFQRGLLHIYLPKLAMHVMIVHLHAHDSVARLLECKNIATLLIPLLANNSRIVLMGDMNTLSPLDAKQHEAINLLHTLQQKTHNVWKRLAKKFLTSDERSIDYKPMNALLETGMLDSCSLSCQLKSGNRNTYLWSTHDTGVYSKCMQNSCSSTEPTMYSAEWPQLPNNEKHPFVRLDYMLISPAILASVSETISDVADLQNGFDAMVEITDRTQLLSDHFPVSLSWSVDGGYDMY